MAWRKFFVLYDIGYLYFMTSAFCTASRKRKVCWMRRHNVLFFMLFFSFVFLGFLESGCSSTRVQPITLGLRYEAAPRRFTSASGWSISLDKAEMMFQAIRFHEGKAAYSGLFSPSSWSILSEAWAHPGHFEGGAIKAEWIAKTQLDLLNAQELAKMAGFTGFYGTSELSFGSGDRVLLRGDAEKEGAKISFEAAFDLQATALQGIAVGIDITTQSQGLVLRIHAERWFDLVDIARFSPASAQAPAAPDESSQNILRKAAQSAAHFSIQKGL